MATGRNGTLLSEAEMWLLLSGIRSTEQSNQADFVAWLWMTRLTRNKLDALEIAEKDMDYFSCCVSSFFIPSSTSSLY